MNLVHEIVEILSGANPKIEDALIKTKVLLHRLGEKQYVDWVNRELNGYSDDDEVPPYRVLPAAVKLTITDGLTRRYKDFPAQMSQVDPKVRGWLDKYELRQSISALESMAKSEGDTLGSDIAPELWGQLSKGISKGFFIEYARSQTSKAGLLGVITQIRSRLLDFVLELETRLPRDASDEDVKKIATPAAVGNLLNNAMFGHNTTIVIGDRNTQHLNFSVVQKGDFESLSTFLKSRKVPETDVAALRAAIDSDASAVEHQKKELGPKVKSWRDKMIAKAVETSWQIEVGIAGNLLASALGSYYGWF